MVRGRPYSVDLRERVLKLKQDGLGYGKIGKTLNMSKSAVQGIINKDFFQMRLIEKERVMILITV